MLNEVFAGDRRIAPNASDSNSVRLVYGEYRVRVSAKGFNSSWRTLRVAQSLTLVQVELAVGGECPPKNVLHHQVVRTFPVGTNTSNLVNGIP
jgi:hypothetical protein